MAKKDRKEFGQNPFSVLKGFSAPAAPALPAPAQTPAVPAAESPLDFATAMDGLGVRRLRGAASKTPIPAPAEPPAAVPVPPPLDDAEEFRRALGELPVTFRDELPDEPVLAAPRLTRLVRKGELHPEATLDLHGVTRAQLRDKLRWFFEDSSYHGLRLLRIVTGRGLSSGSDPVLRGEVERYLRFDAAAWVAEWDRAPGRLGGAGALLVLLKGPKP